MRDVPDDLREALRERYDLERPLGRGGMASVYLARDVKHARHVAVKVMHRELTASLAAERFLQEIQIAARLTHPHILMLIDSGQVGDVLYFVMPYVAGESLRARLLRERRLSSDGALALVREVADALEYAHRQGIIHRDIKPENVLLAEGHAVVADFGIAKALLSAGGQELTRTGYPLGTPGYMSPEQAAGVTDLDARTDVYSLACVAYELLVGETPGMWLEEEAVRLSRFVDASPTHREVLDHLPGGVEQALAGALAMRRESRYPTPAQFAEALARGMRGGPVLSEDEARAAIARAAAIELRREAVPGNALSLGGVQRIAAEVGIAPDDVARALSPEPRRTSASFGDRLLGYEGRIEATHDLPVALPASEFPTLLREIRLATGEIGQLSATLRASLEWSVESRRDRRRTQVIVAPGREGTTIHLIDDDTVSQSVAFAPLTAGSLVVLGIVGAIADSYGASDFVAALVGLGASGSVFGTGLAFVRAALRRRRRRREDVVSRVMARLTGAVRQAGDASALEPPTVPSNP